MAEPGLPQIFTDLVRLEIDLWNLVDARIRRDHDLPLGQFELMRVIARFGSCRVLDIADDLAITVGGVSKIVDRLEAGGYCRRRPNPTDRRSSIVELTAGGASALVAATASFEDELEYRLGAALSGTALRQFGSALARLRSAVRTSAPIERPAE